MNTRLNQGPAKIYQFPAGGRSALGGRRYEASKPAAEPGPPRVHEAACGSGWYHEAAIQETKPGRER
jgi:uncharacterized protein DUF2735